MTRTETVTEGPGTKGAYRQAARAVLTCLWVVLALAFIYVKGRALALDTYPMDRLRFHAIPIAVSEHYRGRVHDYTGYIPLAHAFQESAQLDDLIAWAVETPLSLGDPTYFWAADDHGMVDYVIGAFAWGTFPHAPTLRSLRLFTEEVMPAFAGSAAPLA